MVFTFYCCITLTLEGEAAMLGRLFFMLYYTANTLTKMGGMEIWKCAWHSKLPKCHCSAWGVGWNSEIVGRVLEILLNYQTSVALTEKQFKEVGVKVVSKICTRGYVR